MLTAHAIRRAVIGIVAVIAALSVFGLLGRKYWNDSQSAKSAGFCVELEIDRAGLRNGLLADLRENVRALLRKHKIGVVGTRLENGKVKVRLARETDTDAAVRVLLTLQSKTDQGRPLVSVARESFAITVALTSAAIEESLVSAMTGSIERVKQRLMASGAKVVKVEAKNKTGLRAQFAPPAAWKSSKALMNSSPPRVGVHVIRSADSTAEGIPRSRLAGGTLMLPDRFNSERAYLLDRIPIFTGPQILGVDLSRERVDLDYVTLRLGTRASQHLSAAQRSNLDRSLALVIDNRVFAVSTVQSQGEYGILRFAINAERARNAQIIPLIRLSLTYAKLNVARAGPCS